MTSKNDTSRIKSSFSKPVAIPGLIIIIGICLFCGLFPNQAETTLSGTKEMIFRDFSWMYLIMVSIFLLFLIILALSKLGNIKLGSDNSTPQYSFLSWMSMLFAAGMGVGLMYFGVAETISHYTNPAIQDTVQRAKDAQLNTFFHWGIHGWAIYGLVGLALAYFAYRYKMPVSIRSGFYPLLKDKVNGPIGHVIDVFALCSTFFGIATTLGFGVVQLNAGFDILGWTNGTSFMIQVIIVLVIMAIAVATTMSGLDKGIKKMSEVNLILAVLLMVAILILGPTTYILGTFSEGIGYYISNLANLTFKTYAFEESSQEWFSNWTILYWAWWISWAPFVGLFIARISKGRTVREFVLGVLLVPSLFNFLWMTVFGSSAVWLDIHIAGGELSALASQPDALLFRFFDYFPLSSVLSIASVLIIAIFFITSANSGILVMNTISSDPKKKVSKWQNIIWGGLLAVLSLTLLRSGGLSSLQTMTLISALPFGLIMLVLCYCLVKAMYGDYVFHNAKFHYGSSSWDGKHWKERLGRILTFSKKRDIKVFLNETVLEAFKEVLDALAANDIEAHIIENPKSRPSIELVIRHDKIKNFKYGVAAEPLSVSDYMIEEDNTPDINSDIIYVPVTYFNDGRQGNDIQYMTKDEVIADVLKEYERFISLISDQRNALLYMDN